MNWFDTGDIRLDNELVGYWCIVVGYREFAVVKVDQLRDAFADRSRSNLARDSEIITHQPFITHRKCNLKNL